MGIIGLENYIDSLYKSAQGSSVFINEPLEKIKFVIDSNQLAYVFSKKLTATNQHGGNYDQIYLKTKELFIAMKPYVEIMIFVGFDIFFI